MKITDYVIHFIILLHLYVIGLLKPEVAERARRMLFLSSLATALAREGIIRRNVLDTLNYDLGLAHNDRCLLIGHELSNSIWSKRHRSKESWDRKWVQELNGVNTDQYLALDDIRRISSEFIQAAPKWVKYDAKRMQSDVVDLFLTHPVIKTMKA